MEPWLDSLSEDWKSEQPSSSPPASSLSHSRQYGSLARSQQYQSRIPHISNSMRKSSTTSTGSGLRLRSTRGKAMTRGEPVLQERSGSKLNVVTPVDSPKYSSLPRRVSNTFSDSQNSVQHHSVRETAPDAETPEWKKRIVNGEDLTSDGFDLFSPSKLEGVFKPRTPSQLRSENDPQQVNADPKPRKPFTLPTTNSFPRQLNSFRPPRARANDLEVLQEVNEDEESDRHNRSAVSSRSSRARTPGSLVRQRVRSLERSSPRPPSVASSRLGDSVRCDPRVRTLSGQREIENEFISPITISKQNSIRATVLRNSLNLNVQELQSKLQDAAANQEEERPTTSSSDKDVSYGHISGLARDSNDDVHDWTLHSMPSSLPSDLSTGTEGFPPPGCVIHHGRPTTAQYLYSERSSSVCEGLGLPQESSLMDSEIDAAAEIRSSPPQRSALVDDIVEPSNLSQSAAETQDDASVVHHTDAKVRPAPSASPLKLFGNRDTYTNNRLNRILSQFEDSELSQANPDDKLVSEFGQESVASMSQFGLGHLDAFGFEKDVPRPAVVSVSIDSVLSNERIFKRAPANVQVTNEQETPLPLVNTSVRDFQLESEAGKDNATISKNRTTSKRRKTLLGDHVSVGKQEIELKTTNVEEIATLAGTKRKDAKPGDDGILADPDTLASRSLLCPVSARQRSKSRSASATPCPAPSAELGDNSHQNLTDAVAAKLADVIQEVITPKQEPRKASMGTKDYMEEANKVMEFIRAKVKPMLPLATIHSEAGNISDADSDSTKDDFTRPPSRDRTRKPRPDPRHARHNSRIASHLRKYREDSDTEILTNISGVFGPAHSVEPSAVAAPPQPSVQDADNEQQESSPPNMRILNHSEQLRKRKYSMSTVAGSQASEVAQPTHSHNSSSHSSQHTFPSSSSTSGPKGVIPSGSVSIPDRVAGMTFDHEKKLWVKKLQANERQERSVMTEDDPFDSIPDLSIDATQEKAAITQNTQNPNVDFMQVRPAPERQLEAEQPIEPTLNTDQRSTSNSDRVHNSEAHSSLRSKASKHEAKLDRGLPSEPPIETTASKKQPRVVTIAFSSPVVSAVRYTDISEYDFDDLPREEDLPLDESEMELSHVDVHEHKSENSVQSSEKIPATQPDEELSVVLKPRKVSPIIEVDEEVVPGTENLVNATPMIVLTPARQGAVIRRHPSAMRSGTSLLCLTPLSEFSLHQIDLGKNPEKTYVEKRQHPHALRHAHGTLSLAVDELVKAITDAAGDELFWEKLRQLQLAPGKLASVHSLKEYCPVLEDLSVTDNKLEHVGDVPCSIRTFDVRNNMLNDLTSWSHLVNLQYLDVSGNKLETLDGFSSLIHLRSLKANNNRITSIEGIFDLSGLLDLEVHDNDISTIDFAHSRLRRLRTLDLSHNQIKEIRHLDRLTKLEELDVSYNAIEKWHAESSSRSLLLRTLRASHNKLAHIDLEHMPVLELLDLDNNHVNHIAGLSNAWNLDFLSLREQENAPEIVNFVLSTNVECRHVRLASNSLVNGTISLPSRPQHNIRKLEIAACGIATLPEKFGSYFPNCRDLNINYNAIKDLAPLRGMVKLTHIFAAKNRIDRMRRTCIVLSKFTSLREIDIRENPLTVGFYNTAPWPTETNNASDAAIYHLPPQSPQHDVSWSKRLDEVTGMKRRTIELLLTENCKSLLELDGMPLQRIEVAVKDPTWNKLTERGVLAIPQKSPTSVGSKKRRATGMLGGKSSQYSTPKSDGDVFD